MDRATPAEFTHRISIVYVDARTVKNQKMSFKRRTDLKIWPSEAKYLEEPDFDVKTSLTPRKSAENYEKPNPFPEKKSEKKIRRQKIEICKSSETRVAEVSRRSERSSRGKRTFEIFVKGTVKNILSMTPH